MIPLPLITHAIAACAAAAAAWMWQANSYGQQIANLKTEYAQAQVRAVEVAHAETIRLQSKADAADKAARVRANALALDVAGTRSALVSLSNAADSALRNAQTSGSACESRATALTDVFKGCAGQLQQVAAEADRIASDKQTLIDAWPR